MRTKTQISADRAAAAARRRIGESLRRIREDAGLTRANVAGIAGIDASYLGDIEEGAANASVQLLFRVATALDADLGFRLFPNTGPRIRDRLQAPMVEALLGLIGRGWDRHPEVVVHRPVRCVIDLVLAARAAAHQIVSVEFHSDLRRVEQQLRWAVEKSDALPSATIWPALASRGATARVSRLLVLRSTSRTRSLVRQFASTFEAAYPADPADVLAALAGPRAPWPGNGLLWARVEGGAARILRGRPRGLARG
jgi:transcriptional regulator with XRE-family HTH domain